jgi:primosomal protein N' (replication factor Y)
LLYGITWSGKTEIYIKRIQQQLENNKQSLLLIPEIILSNQLSTKIKQVFWDDVLIINSTVSAAKRTSYWMDIYTGKAKIIVWTRSALFYPYNNLWLIIVDEEHDNSYVSDQAPRFHSLDIVNKISDILRIPLLLASGTPSVTTMYKSIKWEYKQVTLLEKYKRPE